MPRTLVAALAAAVAAPILLASSHREAPFVTENPKVDGTDFYMFNSYEPGREGFVTIVANYVPLQDAYGGPNYFTMDPNALYAIHIDNDGDAKADLSFEFTFRNENKNIQVPAGGATVSIPLIAAGGISAGNTAALNVLERFAANVRLHDAPGEPAIPVINAFTNDTIFVKPVDNIGAKTIADYDAYADAHVYTVFYPGSVVGRLFVGQRKEPFVVNLGEVFDLVNLNPVGPPDGKANIIGDKNVTSIVLEVPASLLQLGGDGDPVIGGWTTASLPARRELRTNPTFGSPTLEVGPFVQVSRLGMPLVNEVVIGLKDKNLFNASSPEDDGQFLTYVTNPTLPVLLNILFGVAPPCTPRNDLVAVFLTGVAGLNQPVDVVPSEMLRLNTAIPATPFGEQDRLGVLGNDLAGFPNGRRPGDDVVDIALRAAMGVLLDSTCSPNGQLPYTDGAYVDDSFFLDEFPYLLTPLPGSPNSK